MEKGGGKWQIYDVNNEINERMLDVRETHAHTKDNDNYVYRAKGAHTPSWIALFGKSRKERPKATYELCGRDRE